MFWAISAQLGAVVGGERSEIETGLRTVIVAIMAAAEGLDSLEK